MEVILQILGEFLLQAIGQALIELGMHAMIEPFLKPPNPWLASVGYIIFGAIFGFLSLLVFPEYLVHLNGLRITNLILTPIAVGGCMVALGSWRTHRKQSVLRIDRFAYGYLFALAIGLVRFRYAK